MWGRCVLVSPKCHLLSIAFLLCSSSACIFPNAVITPATITHFYFSTLCLTVTLNSLIKVTACPIVWPVEFRLLLRSINATEASLIPVRCPKDLEQSHSDGWPRQCGEIRTEGKMLHKRRENKEAPKGTENEHSKEKKNNESKSSLSLWKGGKKISDWEVWRTQR